jgi:hypothetical protein
VPHRSDRVQLTAFAKGRVERANLTLQDRLVKELRLRGISPCEAANAWAPCFIADFNRRFGKPPRSDHNAHRPLHADGDLRQILAWRVPRLPQYFGNANWLYALITFTFALSSRSSVTCFRFSQATCLRVSPFTERAVWLGPRLQP